MKIQISRIKENTIATAIDLRDMKKGEIAHVVCELERVKKLLLIKWEKLI